MTTTAAQTITKTLADLAVGDIVFAVAGKPRPFPYEVTRVVTMATRRGSVTTVHYAHGGFVLPCDSTTKVTVSAV